MNLFTRRRTSQCRVIRKRLRKAIRERHPLGMRLRRPRYKWRYYFSKPVIRILTLEAVQSLSPGEYLEVGGSYLFCVEGISVTSEMGESSCQECCFYRYPTQCQRLCCTPMSRSDGKSVHFRYAEIIHPHERKRPKVFRHL